MTSNLSAEQEQRIDDYFDGYALIFMQQIFHQCSISVNENIYKKNFCFILLAAIHFDNTSFSYMLEKYYPALEDEDFCSSLKILHNLCQGNIDDSHKIIANKNDLSHYKNLKKNIGQKLSNKITNFLVTNYRVELYHLGLYEITNLGLLPKENAS